MDQYQEDERHRLTGWVLYDFPEGETILCERFGKFFLPLSPSNKTVVVIRLNCTRILAFLDEEIRFHALEVDGRWSSGYPRPQRRSSFSTIDPYGQIIGESEKNMILFSLESIPSLIV